MLSIAYLRIIGCVTLRPLDKNSRMKVRTVCTLIIKPPLHKKGRVNFAKSQRL